MGRRSKNRNFWLLLSVAVVLLALVLIQGRLKTSGGEPGRVFPGLDIGKIERVIVRHKERIVLKREKRSWMVVAPGRYRADLLETVKFLKNLAGLRYFREFVVAENALDRYKLDKPETEITIEHGGKSLRLLCGVDLETGTGNTSRSLTWITIAGSGKVYTVETSHITRLQLSLQTIRDKVVLNFERRDLEAVELDYRGRRLAFRKDAKQGWVNAAGKRVERSRLMALLANFYRFKVDDFEADRANPATYGIRPGRNYLRVRGVFGGKRDSKTIYFGRERDGEAMRYCSVSGDPAVYRVGVYKFERLNKQYSDFVPTPATNNAPAAKGGR